MSTIEPQASVPSDESLSRPLDAAMTVRAGRDAYLAENGFVLADYAAKQVTIKTMGRAITIPNTKDRKWAIPLHDLHHVATGYGTDMAGEGEIGAWELGAGCRRSVTYSLNGAAAAMGLWIAPGRVLRAFAAGRRSKALYRQTFDYQALLAEDVASLRERLGVPRDGLVAGSRKLHADAWDAVLRRRGGARDVANVPASLVGLGYLEGGITLLAGVAALVRGSLFGIELTTLVGRAFALALLLAGLFAVSGSLRLGNGAEGGRLYTAVGSSMFLAAAAIAVVGLGFPIPSAVIASLVPAALLIALGVDRVRSTTSTATA